MFVNTLAVREKHYLLNSDNLTQPIQMQLSKNQESSSEIFFAFLNSLLNFEHLPQKKMTLIADVFPEIPTAKKMVR